MRNEYTVTDFLASITYYCIHKQKTEMESIMNSNPLFCYLSSESIAELIINAKQSVCYAGPGIQEEVAQAMLEVVSRLGSEMLTICIDFDERVMRMGYGDLTAVKALLAADIVINHSPGLRNALIIIDGEGFTYTPNALLLEAESNKEFSRNAMRLSPDQVAEALARLSPAAKIIAIAQAGSEEERSVIANIPVEIGSNRVTSEQLSRVEKSLDEAPPVKFDTARQVRVFDAYFQYVELKLTGAAIQRRKLELPQSILDVGKDDTIQKRLHTTFNLISSDSSISSKGLVKSLDEIRNGLTVNIKNRGRIMLKKNIHHLEKALKDLQGDIEKHKKKVKDELQDSIDKSCKDVVQYYLPLIMKRIEDGNPPYKLLGRARSEPPSEQDATDWLSFELEPVFPTADTLIKEIELVKTYKDVTFETLNSKDFVDKVKSVYPNMNWDSLYDEFQAMGEKS